jgi:hypothetical protein
MAICTLSAKTFRSVIDRRRTVKILAMAGKTFDRRFAKPKRNMTLPAFRALMFPLQYKRRFAMIEIHLHLGLLPRLGRMAIRARQSDLTVRRTLAQKKRAHCKK